MLSFILQITFTPLKEVYKFAIAFNFSIIQLAKLCEMPFIQASNADSFRTYKLELYPPAPPDQCWYSNPKSLALE